MNKSKLSEKLSQIRQCFPNVWTMDPYLQIFFKDPIFTSDKFSAQPMRKYNTNPKINSTKSVEKQVVINRQIIFPKGQTGAVVIEKNSSLKNNVLKKKVFTLNLSRIS